MNLQTHQHALPFASHAAFGEGHLLARLGAGAPPVGFPLLDWSGAGSADSPANGRMSLRAIFDARPGRNPGNRELAELIDDPTTRLVIGGQQPGLLLGPLYSFLKAAGAIAAARRLRQTTGRPWLGAFWIASDDHDLEEVDHFHFGDRKFTAAHPQAPARDPRPSVGDVSLEENRGALLDFLAPVLKARPHGPWLLEILEGCSFASYSRFFADLLAALMGERPLLIIDSAQMRPASGAPLAAMVERWPELVAALAEGARRMREAGFTPPLENLNLFHHHGGLRHACAFDDRTMSFGGRTRSFKEAADYIRAHPGDFSPGAALRPLVQDALLPVGLTLGGPTELLYLWQIDELYRRAGVRRSSLWPRPSATILPPAIYALARKLELWPDRLDRAAELAETYQPDAAAVRDPAIDGLEASGRGFLSQFDQLVQGPQGPAGAGQDKNLSKSRESIEHQLGKAVGRLRELHLAATGVSRKDWRKAAATLQPRGQLQERAMTLIEPLAEIGPRLIDTLIDALGPAGLMHHHLAFEDGSEHSTGRLSPGSSQGANPS